MTVFKFIQAFFCVLALSGAAVLFLSRQQKARSVWSDKIGMRSGTVNTDPFYNNHTSQKELELVEVDSVAVIDDDDDKEDKEENYSDDEKQEGKYGENWPKDISYDNNTENVLTPLDDLHDWPALDSLIGNRKANIKGDVQFMLNFAIIGHPKTATTSTMNWLHSHPEIQMYNYELRSLALGKPAELVSLLYSGLKPGRRYKRGYKAPRDLVCGPALNAIAKYWPKTKLMVGLRHPVLWFESFYNFRILMGYKMPPAEALLGKLKDPMFGVSTDEAKFHLHLDNLGKTDRSPEELRLLSWGNEPRLRLSRMKNPVFLYELNQLHDVNQTRAEIYRSDLKHFLGLKIDLKPMAPSSSSSSSSSSNHSKAIEICDPKFRIVRAELMKNAKEASRWIRTYFLKSPDVSVSSPEYFDELLASWMVDPCIMR